MEPSTTEPRPRKRSLAFLYMLMLNYIGVMGQTALTSAHNAPRTGDSLVMRRLTALPLPMVGRGVTWDYSQASKQGHHTLVYSGSDVEIAATGGGTSWRTVFCNDTMSLTGFENRHTLVQLDTPLPLLRYPFKYGDSISGQFHGMGAWCDRKYMRIWGEGTTRGEGEGTLILPGGDTLRHALLVRSVRRAYHKTYDNVRTWDGLSQAVANDKSSGAPLPTCMEPVITETCSWYVPGYRYPVVSIERSSDDSGSTTIALAYPPESQSDLDYDMANTTVRLSPGQGEDGRGIDDIHAMTVHSITSSEASEEIIVTLTLSEAATVSLAISDAAGISWRSMSMPYDTGGDHTMTVSYAGLPRGQYAVRVCCGTDITTGKFKVK